MSDLAKRLENAASTVKYDSHSIDWEKHDMIFSLLREASSRITLLETLVTPLAFSYRREGDFAHVKLEGELDMEDVGQFLEVLAGSI